MKAFACSLLASNKVKIEHLLVSEGWSVQFLASTTAMTCVNVVLKRSGAVMTHFSEDIAVMTSFLKDISQGDLSCLRNGSILRALEHFPLDMITQGTQ